MITQAFSGVELGEGVGLWEGRALDDYEDAQGIAASRARDERSDWGKIPIYDLRQCESSLTFADPKGVRFLLPAFLLAELNGDLPAGVLFCLTEHHNLAEHFSALSAAQRAAVRQFLLLLEDHPDYQFDRPNIQGALMSYWKE